jgi:hypothetical protein
MAVEDEQGTEQKVEDQADVELHSAPDVADDDDDVEAHVWRAQT